MFIISGLLIVSLIVIVALFPALFTEQNPNYCTLENSLAPASAGHLRASTSRAAIGTRVVYGTRTSLSVGLCATILVVILGTSSAPSPASSAAGSTPC